MRACVYMYLIGLPDVLGVLASADWALAPVVAMATAATRTVDLEIMIDMSGVCGGAGVRGCGGAWVWGWVVVAPRVLYRGSVLALNDKSPLLASRLAF